MEPKINDLTRIMHWISFLFSRLRFFSLYSSLRRPLNRKRSETITNYKLLTLKNTTNNRSFDLDKNHINKYCHVSAYVAYDNCDPVFKKTFKFEISPGAHNSIIWDKIIATLNKNGIKVELKS